MSFALPRILVVAAAVVFLAAAVPWVATRPSALDPSLEAALAKAGADPERGEAVFWAAGCASCHTAPDADDSLVLAGGQRFASPFGSFVAPNVSTDPIHGIGGWTVEDFARALTEGVSPQGRHYYPAFPYTAYTRMTPQDIADLHAFWTTLPASDVPSAPHEIGFPFNIRRGLGIWKALYLDDAWIGPADDASVERGRYLSEALAHCGECHTPRGPLGALDTARWMAGAPNPSGRGTIPNITPAELDWTAGDIAYYLETGFMPDFDTVGGHMAAVVSNFAKLSAEDRQAVAAYVKALPPIPAE